MALPTKTNVQTMDYSMDGSPWVLVPSKAAVDPNTMDYSMDGSPWWGNPDSSPGPTSNIESFNGLLYASTGTVNGLTLSSIDTYNGLA